jgi:hypothetical protein
MMTPICRIDAGPVILYAVLAVGLSAGCAFAGSSASGRDPTLAYVSNSRDNTITRLHAATGRVVGSPIPAGVAPGPVVVGRDGDLVTISSSARHEAALIVSAGRHSIGATIRLPLEPRAQPLFLAGAGGRYAAVAYSVRMADRKSHSQPCRLALIDLPERSLKAGFPVCSGHEVASGMALEEGPFGPIAYVGLWREADIRDGATGTNAGRVVARDLRTGQALDALPLDGVPGNVVLGASSWGTGQRLYVVYAQDDGGSSHGDDIGSRFAGASAWHLLSVDPRSLAPERTYSLRFAPRRLAIAPDGRHAYALTGGLGTTTVWHIDLTTGVTGLLVGAVVESHGLAVTHDHVLLSDTDGGSVWLIQRQSGHIHRRVPVGRKPLGIAVGL